MALTNHPEDEILSVTLDTGEDEQEGNTFDTNKDNGDNNSKQLNTDTMEITPEHPVYVEGKGWILAENLSIGDRLRRVDGGMAKVLAIERVALDTPESVYNFTVKGPHTYFVLEAGVLVHNVSCEWNPDSKQFHATEEFEVNGTKYEKGQPVPDEDAAKHIEQWVGEKLAQGDVLTILDRFGANPKVLRKLEMITADLQELGKKFKDSGVPPTKALRLALLEVMPEGYTFAGRSIPRGSYKYHGLLDPKPAGAKTVLKGPNGIRLIIDTKGRMGPKGGLRLIVSDLDPGALLDDMGRVVSEKEFYRRFIDDDQFNEAFAKYLGIDEAEMMDHGTQIWGHIFKARGDPSFANVPYGASRERVFTITKNSAAQKERFRKIYLANFIKKYANPDDPIAQEFLRNLDLPD